MKNESLKESSQASLVWAGVVVLAFLVIVAVWSLNRTIADGDNEATNNLGTRQSEQDARDF